MTPTPLARLTLLACLPLLCAQTSQPYDAAPLLEKLASPASAKAAAASIEKLPASALGPLYDALLDPDTPASVKAALDPEVTKLHARIREESAAAHKASELAWFNRTGPDLFRKLPHANPAADALAQKCLDNITKDPLHTYDLAKAAADAGSKDPLILYYLASRAPGTLSADQRIALAKDALAAFDATSPYPPSRKIFTLIRCAAIFAAPANAPALKTAAIPANRADQLLTQALALLPTAAKDNLPDAMIRDLFDSSRALADRINKNNAAQTYNRLFAPFNTAFPNNPAILAYAAEFNIDWAWQARGSGVASTVTSDGWDRFKQRLDQAEKFALQSIQADPAAPDGPTAMLNICLGKSYDRPLMDAWFNRAMNANPANYDACVRKENYLLPQWNGSPEEVLAFARQCAINGAGRIPLILVDAHQELRSDSSDPAAYMHQTEVWADIQSAYEKVLDEEDGKVPPETLRTDRTRYLKFAAECQQWDDFHNLAEKFGDDLDLDLFGGKALLDFYKKKATAAAAKQPI